jgi:hypothetical protein
MLIKRSMRNFIPDFFNSAGDIWDEACLASDELSGRQDRDVECNGDCGCGVGDNDHDVRASAFEQ